MDKSTMTDSPASTNHTAHSAIVKSSYSGNGELDFEAKARREREAAAAWGANFDAHQPGGRGLSCNDPHYKKLVADYRKEQAAKQKAASEMRKLEEAKKKGAGRKENNKEGAVQKSIFRRILSRTRCS